MQLQAVNIYPITQKVSKVSKNRKTASRTRPPLIPSVKFVKNRKLYIIKIMKSLILPHMTRSTKSKIWTAFFGLKTPLFDFAFIPVFVV